MTTTTDRAAELRAEIDGCNALIAYHTATGNSAAAGNFRARLKEYTDELRQMEENR